MTRDQPDFLNHILWTDESGFTQDGIMGLQNLHIYSDKNPRVTPSNSFLHRFRVNVWAGILGNTLIGPFIIADRIRGANYLNFEEDIRRYWMICLYSHNYISIWNPLYGAPAHFTLLVSQWLDDHFPGRWIGRGGQLPGQTDPQI